MKSAKAPALLIKKGQENYAFSNGFYIFEIKNKEWNPKFILYLFRSPRFREILDNHLCRGIGISTYKERDLLKIRIPIISKEIQDSVLVQIESLEKMVLEEKSMLEKPIDVIHREILGDRPYDIEKFSSLDKIKVFKTRLSKFSNSEDLRFGVNFHHPKYGVIDQYFEKQPSEPLSDLIRGPITLGKSPVYDDSGEAFYLTMATIKSYEFDLEDARKLKDKFYLENKGTKPLERNDILLARSGLGTIGKVALMEEDFPNIYCDFTMRIRTKEASTAQWLYYFMRTDLFQLEILRWKKGMGNLMNIFPSQVEKLKILHLSNSERTRKAASVKQKLIELQDKNKKVNRLRGKISDLVVSSLETIDRKKGKNNNGTKINLN